MRRVFERAVLALVLIAAIAPNAKADHFDCKLIAFSNFTMDAEPSGRVMIPVPANGQTLHLLIDTGASISIVNQTTAAASGARIFQEPNSVEMFGGYTTHDFTILQSPIFDHLKSRFHSFFIVPDAAVPAASGLLGGDILKHFDVEFDFANNHLTIFSHDHCPGNVVYWTKEPYAQVPFTLDRRNHIRLQVLLDGVPVLATLDTGSTSTIASLEHVTGALHIDSKDAALTPSSDKSVAMPGYHYPFKSLTFEGVTIWNPNVVLVSDSTSKLPVDQWQLIIGMNILRRLHIYISYGEETLYLTDAAAH